MSTVVDLGAGENPDPRADVTVDVVAHPQIDIIHDLEETPWPLDDRSADRIVAHQVLEHLAEPWHAFEEAARVLTDGGAFEIDVPLGIDARTDPTHAQEWTWETPAYFTRDPPYDYGWNLPFTLLNREVDVWIDGPWQRVGELLLDRLLTYGGPGKWLSSVPGLSGVLSVTYRRCPR